MQIIVDTREQRPYGFDGAIRRKLDAGDYSVVGFERIVAVERKTLADFVKTVLRARKRFDRELQTLASYESVCVVVEASEDDVRARRYQGAAPPAAILGLADRIERAFGIPVVWAGDRQRARAYTELFLCRTAARIQARMGDGIGQPAGVV